MKKQIKFKLLGMDTDSDVSIVDGTSSIENHNIRFTVTEDGLADTAISNERGTKLIDSINISGTPIGCCTIQDFLILFIIGQNTDENIIQIYKYKDNIFSQYYTYKGNFGFQVEAPIECQVVSEREDLLKVFWVDGKNPLRFLIIPTSQSAVEQQVSSKYFDVIKELDFSTNLQSSISVSKQTFGGIFPVGTIQYAFTYYNKYGSESNIFKITPLFYISNSSSGAPSDRSMSCSFQIKISNVDKKGDWDYIRIYSIRRTAINGTPICKRVIDISIKEFNENSPITYVDNGQLGETVDSTRLLYVGGEKIIPKTIAQKDGTLFLGNYRIIRSEISKEAKDILKQEFDINKESFFNTTYVKNSIKYARKMVSVIETEESIDTPYQYTPQLLDSQNKITTFKSGETYRIGVQLQDTTGRWSDPIFLFDSKNSIPPNTLSDIDNTQDLTRAPQNGSGFTPPIDTMEDIVIDLGGGSQGTTPDDPNNGVGGGSSSDTTVSNKVVKSAIKALLPFGYLNMKLQDIQFTNNGNTVDMLSYLKSLGYNRIRPIIVYPNESNREVLFQGVANPTIRKGQSKDTFDYRIPSWFFRPVESNKASTAVENNYGYNNIYNIGDSFNGVHPVFKHDAQIPYYKYEQLYHNVLAEFQYETTDKFWIDWSVLTIDSPDIRFNEQLSLCDLSNVKARVVGLIDFSGNAASYSIYTNNSIEPVARLQSSPLSDTIPMGNKVKIPFQYLSGNINSSNYGACLINYPLWIDGFSDRGGNDGHNKYEKYFANWYIYPWHRNGSLNNCSSKNMNNIEGAEKPSVLKRKILANQRFCYTTVYGRTNQDNLSIKHSKIFIQSSEAQIDRFPDGSIFRNKVDIVLPASGLPSFQKMGGVITTPETDKGTADQIYYSSVSSVDYTETSYSFEELPNQILPTVNNILNSFYSIGYEGDIPMRYYDPHHDNWGNDNTYHIGNDPIPMQFKTGSNCIVQLESYLNYEALNFIDSGSQSFKLASQGYWLPLIELYREVENKFGGSSEDAIKQNAWLVAGNPVNLTNDIDLFWDCGDTYFQRYDCLKTMPLDNEKSVNNIIEILSFFCETRINIDGRCDTNRGIQDNTVINEGNFNLINDVYTQLDNYFQYYVNDEDLNALNSYQNQIIWSLTKNSGDLVDPWTNITLLNSLDLDGSKGQLRSIKNFNGQLYAFQDTGISSINYNQNIVLNSEKGVPVEIANSGKVTGNTYLSTNKGCINKWAIVDIGQGLIFLDSLNKELDIFDGRQIVNLGEKTKFQSWIKSNCGSTDEWNPSWENIDGNTITFLYDKEAGEILLTSNNFSVAFNLGLLKFTSFYNYERCPWIVNIDSQQILIGQKRNKEVLGDWKAWNIRQGKYNEFLGTFKPYSIQFIATDKELFNYTKLFYNIEIRDTVVASLEDTYSKDEYQLQNKFSFDHIRVTDSYQDSDTQTLQFKRNLSSNLKSKFRTWRIDIPRNSNRGIGRIKDRIMDHYMTVTLSHLNESYEHIKVHDITALYMI